MKAQRLLTLCICFALLVAATPNATAYKGHQLSRNDIVDFTLVDQNAENFTFSTLDKDVTVVAFIFTACPDVCPVITQSLRLVQEGLSESDAERVGFVSISVDPAYDTPEVLHNYTHVHDVNWPHLTGSEEVLQTVWNSFGVAVAKEVIDAHVSMNSSQGMENQVSIVYPDNTTMLLDGHTQTLPSENATGWNLTESTLEMHNVSLNYSVHETWGTSVNGITMLMLLPIIHGGGPYTFGMKLIHLGKKVQVELIL